MCSDKRVAYERAKGKGNRGRLIGLTGIAYTHAKCKLNDGCRTRNTHTHTHDRTFITHLTNNNTQRTLTLVSGAEPALSFTTPLCLGASTDVAAPVFRVGELLALRDRCTDTCVCACMCTCVLQ